jgi:hypothetical protein
VCYRLALATAAGGQQPADALYRCIAFLFGQSKSGLGASGLPQPEEVHCCGAKKPLLQLLVGLASLHMTGSVLQQCLLAAPTEA